MADIKKVLIANRGEIAVRIIRTCREMGINTVAVYSDPDKTAPHVLMADESIHIGKATSSKSYLNIDKIINAAHESDADAIHPGYGFLSENGSFARRCAEEEIIFIGPKAKSIEMMGDKTRARDLMDKAGVPFPPGTKKELESIEDAKKVAENIEFPILIKAAAGGGGKGMRIVYNNDEFESGIRAAQSEARNAFGDDRVYIEKYLENPRHVEFQIIADEHGNTLHLFDRECSIQRRHQKVVEEAPCSILTPELRQEMAEAAIAAAEACDYVGAGTIEFLVDKNRKFYFLEMNTRLQVEHPVTELITGKDLVELQILVAKGEELPFKQEEVTMQGHAIESRIYAEDPAENFLPSTGDLERHRMPSGPGVRVDSGVEEGQTISVNYDPMISKLCVFAENREKAIQRMKRALEEYEIAGCRTTIPFCHFVMNHQSFTSREYDTHFVPNYFEPEKMRIFPENEQDHLLSIASVLAKISGGKKQGDGESVTAKNGTGQKYSNWWLKRGK